MSAPFTTEDTHQMTWAEFDSLINTLIAKVSYLDGNSQINVIAPLLRTGGIVGSVLSIKMKIVTMLPVQFKYSHHPTTINQILSIPDILHKAPQSLNILLCEGNTNSGSIATKAAQVIKEKFPEAKIYLATLTKVFGGPEKLDGIDAIFFGKMTDENKIANEKQKEDFDIRGGITIFPWENSADELSDINAATS